MYDQVEYRERQVCMGGLGEDIAANEPETNDTKRDCVSCLFHLQSFWIHRATCHEGYVAVANTQ